MLYCMHFKFLELLDHLCNQALKVYPKSFILSKDKQENKHFFYINK